MEVTSPPKDSGVGSLITEVDVGEAIKQLHSDGTPEMDKIRIKFPRYLDVVGLSWLTHLCYIDLERVGCSNHRGITLFSLHVKVRSRGEFGNSLNLTFKRNNAVFILALEQWTSSLPL